MKQLLSALSKKLKQYPILFVCGILLPVGILILIMRMPVLDETHDSLRASEEKWHEIEKNLERSRNLNDHLDLINEYSDDLKNRLMKEDRVARNYEFFYRMERESGIEIINIDQKIVTADEQTGSVLPKLEKFKIIPFELTINGEYKNIIHFIERIEHQNFIIRVESVSVGSALGGVDRQQLTARIECYVLGEMK